MNTRCLAVLALLGLSEAASRLPYAAARTGRSLLTAPTEVREPVVTLANENGIWGIDQPMVGAMQAPHKVMARKNARFACFDTDRDPGETAPFAPEACGEAFRAAQHLFPSDAELSRP